MSTVVLRHGSTPAEDAEILHKACAGFGTDEKAIIDVICHRSAYQRRLIRQAYQDIFSEDLINRFEKEISGDFERAVYRWMLDPEERDAVILNVAIKKSSIDYKVIVEYSCVASPDELLDVRRAYQNRFKRSLEEDVAAHSSGHLRSLLVALVSAYRYDGSEVDAKLAKKESDILEKYFKGKEFQHEEVIRILSTRSKQQLKATFNHYKDSFGTTITKNLPKDSENGYIVSVHNVVKCIADQTKYFEKVLRTAMAGRGSDEEEVTRVVVTRAEKDLKGISELYQKRNSVGLEHSLGKETSGNYRKFISALIGKEGE